MGFSARLGVLRVLYQCHRRGRRRGDGLADLRREPLLCRISPGSVGHHPRCHRHCRAPYRRTDRSPPPRDSRPRANRREHAAHVYHRCRSGSPCRALRHRLDRHRCRQRPSMGDVGRVLRCCPPRGIGDARPRFRRLGSARRSFGVSHGRLGGRRRGHGASPAVGPLLSPCMDP